MHKSKEKLCALEENDTMGFIDNIVQSGENDVEAAAQRKMQSALSGGIKLGNKGNAPTCPSCKAQLPSPMPNFCPKCGAKLTVTCTKCKKDYPLGTKFCPVCGSKLT